jgi:predicted nucleic acid-binding protein
MRRPSSTLVVDAAILVAAARGRTSAALTRAANALLLATTERAIAEACRRIEFGLREPTLLAVVDGLTREMTVVPLGALLHLLTDREAALRDAVPSRNGSTSDAHILALAWAIGGDIWTHDRDFAGTGVATWSTANLVLALAKSDG